MQRRPLEPLLNDVDLFQTPLEQLLSVFGCHVDKGHVCATPLIKATCYKELFKLIGFEQMPVGPKGPKKLLYPETAPEGQHPTSFLQFGVQIVSSAHAIFELGDHSRIMRFDFRENWPEGYEQRDPFYQLDEINIWDGGIRYNLDCESEVYRNAINGIFNVSTLVIEAMWRKEPWAEVKQKFETLSQVIVELDSINSRLEQQHSEYMARPQTSSPS